MNIPPEFADYIVTKSHLNLDDQDERFNGMHLLEIRERAAILCKLGHDKELVKRRIKKNIEWAFDLFEMPDFYKSVDSIVDNVYSRG